MSQRGIFCAFAALSGVGASLILPEVSSAQLAETMTSAGIQGQLHSSQKSNLLTPGRKARGIGSIANQKRADEDAALRETGSSQQGSSVGRGVDAANVAPFSEKDPQKGKTYSADGVVVSDKNIGGHRTVLVLKINESNSFQVLAFRLNDPAALPVLAKNTPVRVTAVYAAKIKEPDSGMLVHAFDNAVFESGAQAPGGAGMGGGAPVASEPEKPTFESIMKGWVLRGTVQMAGKATAVFVNEDKVKYAQVGTVIEKGVKVVGVKNGQARVVVDGERFDVTPW